MSVHFSSKDKAWETPQALFDKLSEEFGFTLDPCCTHETAKCKKHFTIEEDGLKQDWSDDVVFMNPPYGREIVAWMKKAYITAGYGTTVVCLVPSRTDTGWWHDYVMMGEVRFLRGRLRFSGAKNNAPFPSAVVIFRPRNNPHCHLDFTRK